MRISERLRVLFARASRRNVIITAVCGTGIVTLTQAGIASANPAGRAVAGPAGFASLTQTGRAFAGSAEFAAANPTGRAFAGPMGLSTLTQMTAEMPSIISHICAGAASFFGGGQLLQTLVIFMILDYITGTACAVGLARSRKKAGSVAVSRMRKTENANPISGRNNIRRAETESASSADTGSTGRADMLIMSAVSASILEHTTVYPDYSFVRTTVIIAFTANEALSIIENAANMGVPIPAKLRRAIAGLKDES